MDEGVKWAMALSSVSIVSLIGAVWGNFRGHLRGHGERIETVEKWTAEHDKLQAGSFSAALTTLSRVSADMHEHAAIPHVDKEDIARVEAKVDHVSGRLEVHVADNSVIEELRESKAAIMQAIAKINGGK